MPFTVYLERRRGPKGVYLAPADALSEERLCQIKAKPGDILKADIVRPRNGKHHRWFMALMKVTAEALSDPAWTPESLRFWLKVKTGLVKIYEVNGERVAEVGSMSFASMKQDEFNDVSERMIGVICTELIPGMNPGDLRREVELMVAPELERA